VLLAVAALLVRLPAAPRANTVRARGPGVPLVVALLVICLALLAAAARIGDKSAPAQVITSVVFLGAGMLLGCLLAALETGAARCPYAPAVPVALAVAAVGLVNLLRPAGASPHAQLGLVAGAGLSAWMLGIGAARQAMSWPSQAAVLCAAFVACDFLGAKQPGTPIPQIGLTLGVVVALSALAAGLLSLVRGQAAKAEMVTPATVLAVVLMAVLSQVLSRQFLGGPRLGVTFVEAAALAAATLWLLPAQPRGTGLRFSLASLLWVAAGTVAFAQGRALAMSLVLTGAVATMLLLQAPRALLALGLLGSLTYYRVFRELFTDASRALDLGQHYALIGLLLAATLPLLLLEWRRRVPADARGPLEAVGGALFILMSLGLPLGAALVLGAKGVVGYLAGLGLACFVEGHREDADAEALPLSLGLSAALCASFGLVATRLDLSRAARLPLLYWTAGLVVVAAVVLLLVSQRQDRRPASDAARA
jgi:hypothetical protein